MTLFDPTVRETVLRLAQHHPYKALFVEGACQVPVVFAASGDVVGYIARQDQAAVEVKDALHGLGELVREVSPASRVVNGPCDPVTVRV